MSNSSNSDSSWQAQVDELRSELALMRAELTSLRNSPRTSLKLHNRCPSCQGTSVLHCNEIRDYNNDNSHSPMSIQLMGVLRKRAIGSFEAYICRQCEFVEWYLKGAADIVPGKLDKRNRKNIRIVDSEMPKDGPFR